MMKNKISEITLTIPPNAKRNEEIAHDEEEDSEYLQTEDSESLKHVNIFSLRAPAVENFKFELMDEKAVDVFRNSILGDEFINLQFYQDQVYFIAEKTKKEAKILTWKQIGQIFGVSRSAVKTIYDRIITGKQSHGRPRVFSNKIEAQMIEWILAAYTQKEIIHYDDVHNWLKIEQQITILPNTLIKIINSIPLLKVVKGKPMEQERVNFDHEEVQEYFRKLTIDISDAPASLIINIDECGYQEWADAHDEKIIVSIKFPGDTIEIPNNRAQRRSAMVASIPADGGTLKLMIIVSRKTIELELYETGYTPNECMFVFQENGFINKNLFIKWFSEVLIPYVQQERGRLSYSGSAYLILDGCSTHLSDEFYDLAFEFAIELEILPPHTSDQFQPLDVGVFAKQKSFLLNDNDEILAII
jgi:hypothetical protein